MDLYLITDAGKNGGNFLLDATTRKRPRFSEGNKLSVYLGAFLFDLPYDLSGFDRIRLIIKDSDTASDAEVLASISVDSEDFESNLVTLNGWNERTEYNVLFEVPAAQLAYNLGDLSSKEIWMVVTAFRDDPADEVTLGAGAVTLVADNDATPEGPEFMTKAVYDSDGDGVVDRAERADAVDWDDVDNKPDFGDLTGAVLYSETMTLSAEEKGVARTNIGAITLTEAEAAIAARAVRFDVAQVLSGGQSLQARTNIGAISSDDAVTLLAARAVRFDVAQVLSSPQQAQARANLGISTTGLSGAVLYEAQTLTTEQKTQARNNIGALGSVDLTGAVLYSEAQALSEAERALARANIGAAETQGEAFDKVVLHLKEVDTIEGATSNCLQDIELDDEPWADLTLPAVVAFVEEASGYLLTYAIVEGDGTEVHDAPTVVLPNNYSYPARPRYFRLVSSEGTVHANLEGLEEDDHPQYLLADGTRNSTGFQQFLGLKLASTTDLEVDSGVATPTQSAHKLYLDGGSSGSLTNLTPPNGNGDFLLLTAKTGYTFTLEHNASPSGNIRTASGASVTITSEVAVLLWYVGSYWLVIHSGTVTGGGEGGDTLPVTDTTAIAKDPVDGTKRVRLDAGAVSASNTRAIQAPNGDSRIRDVLTFQIYASDEDLSDGFSDFLWAVPIGATFVAEHVAAYVIDRTGIEESPEVTIFRNGAEWAVVPIQYNATSGNARHGVQTSVALSQSVEKTEFTYEITKTGAGSAGSAAQGLVICLVGFWKMI